MEQILDYVKPELLVLIPVLYLIGMGLKKASWLQDRFIPITLGCIGIVLSGIYVIALSAADWVQWYDVLTSIFTAIVQGILVAGCSTFCNQIYKQASFGKADETNDSTE